MPYHPGRSGGPRAENNWRVNRHRRQPRRRRAKALGGLFTNLGGGLLRARIGRADSQWPDPRLGHRCARSPRFGETRDCRRECRRISAGGRVTPSHRGAHAAERLRAAAGRAGAAPSNWWPDKPNPAGVLSPGDTAGPVPGCRNGARGTGERQDRNNCRNKRRPD